MKAVFTGKSASLEVNGKESIKIPLASGFEALAGRRSSTFKFIKFWCTSTAIAAGMNQKEVEKFEYLVQEKGNFLIIVSA